METFLNIFKSLGADVTFFYQLALVIIFYFTLKYSLFGKLQEVLDLRENKTTKLEGNANKKFVEAEELAQKYKSELDKVNQEAFGNIAENKNKSLDVQKAKIKETETKLNSEIEAKRKVFMVEVDEHKEKILKDVDSLSNDLVNKLTN